LSQDALTIPATLVRREKYAPVWGVLLKPFEAILGFLPSHRATKKGRASAKQMRVLLMAIGLAVMIFGGTLPLILLGAAVMASALFLPLSEVTKGALRGKLRRLRTEHVRDAETPGTIVYDGRRLILCEGDKKLRRVLVDRGEHGIELRRRHIANQQDWPCLGVRPPSGRKADSIWICSPEASLTADNVEEISGEGVDIWARVTPNSWNELHDLLNK
jgi:hypothetical protein